MVLKANDRRTSSPCHDEFRGPRSDCVRQVEIGITRNVGAPRFNGPYGRQDTWGCAIGKKKKGARCHRVLISRFERTIPLSTRLQLFSSCIQGSSESVQEFAARINKLGTQIFQSSNSAQNMQVRNANNQLLQLRFISGLRNGIRRFVLAQDPNNLEESINAALIEEQNVKLNQIANDERTGLSPLQTETSVISALTSRLEEINVRVERLQEASSVTARKTGGDLFRRREIVFKCYYCGLEGHKQAECRKRRAKERTLNYQPPCGNAAGEFSVFRQPNTHSFDR
ncbi:hypothetical protein TNCV_3794741 [Trichonephila clavipes]|nr:hypothetical protein TNCV_3794741 [Trichonephila clavipes]